MRLFRSKPNIGANSFFCLYLIVNKLMIFVGEKSTYTVGRSFSGYQANAKGFNKSVTHSRWLLKKVRLIHNHAHCFCGLGNQHIKGTKEYSVETTLCAWDCNLPTCETKSPWLIYEWDKIAKEKASILRNVSPLHFSLARTLTFG
jgi:hypothetical protein